MKLAKNLIFLIVLLPLQITAQNICDDFAFNGVSLGPFSHNTKYIDLLPGISGRFYALGSYVDESDSRIMISLVYANGALSPDFGTGGISILGSTDSPVAMASTPAGLAIAGSSGVVHKVHASSGLKFGAISVAAVPPNGEQITDMVANGAFIYVLLQRIDGFSIKAYYYNDGTPLTSFGNNGVIDVVADQPTHGPSRLVRSSDGKFLVALSISSVAPTLEDQVVYRFLSDGTLDTTWDDDGISSEPEGKPYRVSDLLIDGNNKVVVTGNVDLSGDDSYIVTHRWNDDGTGDQTFGSSGTSAIHTSAKGYGADMMVKDNNELVFVGETADLESKFMLAGYDNDGGSTSGLANEEFLPMDPFVSNGRLEKIMSLTSDTFLACGYVRLTDGSTRGIVIKFNSDGSYYPSFGDEGIYMPNVVEQGAALEIKQQADGKYVTVGGHQFAGHGGARIAPAIARFLPDGTLDMEFGYRGGSFVDINQPIWNGHYQNLEVLPDGKIMAYGEINDGNNLNFFVARYNTDGTLDTSFSGDGWLTLKGGCGTSSCQQRYGHGMMDNNGRIILIGSATLLHGSNQQTPIVMRLLSNGELDNSFGTLGNGRVFLDLSPIQERFVTGALYADNSILTGGETNIIPPGEAAYKNFATFAKFTSNGILDVNFGDDGVVYYIPDGSKGAVNLNLRLQDDGTIISLIEHWDDGFNETYSLLRLLPNGQVDTGFGTNGLVEIIAFDKTPRKDGLSINTDSQVNILVTGSVQSEGGFTSKYSVTGDLLATRSYKNSVWPPLTVLPTGPPLMVSDNQLVLVADGDREGFGILCFNLDFPEPCVPVEITTQPPSSVTLCEGDSDYAFSVSATGSDPIYYEWFKDGGSLDGGSSEFILSNYTADQSGVYSCIVTNECSSEISLDITITINPALTSPTVTEATGCNPASVTLTASGTSDGNYRWYDVATGGTALAGEVNSSFVTPSLTNTTDYYAAINDGVCESIRSTITTTIIEPVAITSHPQNQQIDSGDDVTLSVTATGDNIAYQWRKDAVDLTGEIAALLLISNFTAADLGDYTCLVSNDCSSETSDIAIVSSLQVTGIEKNPQNHLVVYPNPSSGITQIVTNLHEKLTVRVYSTHGQIVYAASLSPHETTIDLGKLTNGTYHLVIISSKTVNHKNILINK